MSCPAQEGEKAEESPYRWLRLDRGKGELPSELGSRWATGDEGGKGGEHRVPGCRESSSALGGERQEGYTPGRRSRKKKSGVWGRGRKVRSGGKAQKRDRTRLARKNKGGKGIVLPSHSGEGRGVKGFSPSLAFL